MQKIWQIEYFKSEDDLDKMRETIKFMQGRNLDVELVPFDKGILLIGREQKSLYSYK